uniref:Reverse transcriptase RNase H-like domain-containing protein n=1 Tax=Amphimedon queenslandica TaxID=400682 RepID=A0A1X7UZM9_AMPQE
RLAIVYAVRKFHQYLYGHRFTIYSDHKPLKYLFSVSTRVPVLASARIQRWALNLSTYKYTIECCPGTKIANADALSRLPLHTQAIPIPVPGYIKSVIQQLSDCIVKVGSQYDALLLMLLRHDWKRCINQLEYASMRQNRNVFLSDSLTHVPIGLYSTSGRDGRTCVTLRIRC